VEATLARRARLELIYQGVNLDALSVQVAYTDHAQGQLDELEVRLEDRDGLWRGPRFPGKGERVSARILCLDWRGPGRSSVLDCGSFEIDEVCLDGPPDMVSLKAHSARVSRSARTDRKKTGWEMVGLRTIAGEIAGRAGLQLWWEGNDRFYERVEQREESDLSFLRRLCRDVGNLVKVADEKLIVYAGQSWESRPPAVALVRGQAWIKNYRFQTQAHDIYRGAVVSYWHPQRRELIQARYFPPDAPPTGEVLQINQRVESLAEAERLARSRLKAKNRVEVEAQFTLVGDTRLRAATTAAVEGFGHFDGIYFVEEASHLLDSRGGYTTRLTLLKGRSY